MRRLLIVGCGDVARRALPWLTRRYRVYAAVHTRRDVPALRVLGVVPLLADLDDRRALRRLAGIADAVMHSAPPPDRGERDARTRRLIAALGRSSLPRRLVYISTSGIYGDCAGARVDETRRARPASARARRRLDAERALRRFGRRNRVAVSILRAPGIYASDRLPLERLRRGDPVLRPGDDVYTNHIHALDLARAACRTLQRGRAGRAYNVCDDSELRMGDYFDLVADAFGIARPPRLARVQAAERLPPLTLSFMAESRRLVNTRLKRELGVRLAFPDIAHALAALRAGVAEGMT